MSWRTDEILSTLGAFIIDARTALNRTYNAVHFNSQLIQRQDIFIALNGGKGDGHLYVHDAITRGAELLIISDEQLFNHLISIYVDKCVVLVRDTHAALESMAIHNRSKISNRTHIIAITGSLGKTTTKEALGLCLKAIDDSTFVSYKNFNNYLGLLLNLASLNEDARYIVFELGMNHAGEIERMSNLLRPNIVIITSIACAHLAFFHNLRNIALAKAEIFYAQPNIAIINAESEYSTLIQQANGRGVKEVYSFGGDGEHGKLIQYETLSPAHNAQQIQQVQLTFDIMGQTVSFVREKLPKHFAQNWVAILILAKALQLDIQTFCETLATFRLSNMRFELLNAFSGNISYSIIADCYNASPIATKCALQYLQDFSNTSKIAVLGQMLELGEHSKQMHSSLKDDIQKVNLACLILIGNDWSELYLQLKHEQPHALLYLFSDSSQSSMPNYNLNDGWEERVIELLLTVIKQDCVLLLKAARYFKFERILNSLYVNQKL